MEIDSETSVAALVTRLQIVDRAIARLIAIRLRLIRRIDQLTNTDGANGRVAAATVAAASRCSAHQADADLALARQLSGLPEVVDALVCGAISAGQLGPVATIAGVGSPLDAIALAQSSSSASLERAAAACRRDLADARLRADARRFVSFKPDPDQLGMTMLARGPWHEMDLIRQHVEKAAAQLERGAGSSKSSFSTRLFDALVEAVTHTTTGTTAGVHPNASGANTSSRSAGGVALLERPTATRGDGETSTREPDDTWLGSESIIVTRADTKVVVHYDARSGTVNYQNGPPLDHPRLIALLCDASLEVIHNDNGSPNGIVTT